MKNATTITAVKPLDKEKRPMLNDENLMTEILDVDDSDEIESTAVSSNENDSSIERYNVAENEDYYGPRSTQRRPDNQKMYNSFFETEADSGKSIGHKNRPGQFPDGEDFFIFFYF